MKEFLEENRRLFRFYCVAAQIIGWVLLTVPGIVAVVEVLRGSFPGGNKLLIPIMVRVIVLNFMFLGLTALCVAQLIKYVFDRQYQAGWILRNADKILYSYAFLVVLGALWQCVYQTMILNPTYSSLFFSFLVTWLLPAIAKAMILIGLGQILRRILPVIEESRMLV